jgi:hypothetical protein
MAESNAPEAEYESSILGWAKEALEEGEGFLRAQKGYTLASDSIKAIFGDVKTLQSSVLSQTSVNHIAKVATDLTAMCTDVKPFWEYRTRNQRFKKHCEILGNLSEHWWLNRLIDLKFADVIRYSLVAGTGYSHQYYNTNTNDLDISAEDPRDIIPIRPPSTSFSLQECAGVIQRVQRTVNYVRAKYPDKAHLIVPDRDGSVVAQSLQNSRIGQLFDTYGSPFRERLFNERPAKELPRIPSVDLYTAYLTDDSINKSSSPKYMGDWADGKPINNWSYKVDPGQPLYPRKRCIVFTTSTVLYDGPSIYWHGLFPFAKLTLDPWPWTWLGKGILWDILSLQKSIDGVMRVLDDHLEQVARPAVIGDKTTISQSDMNKIDTRKAGLKVRQNMLTGKGITIQPPPSLPSDVMAILQYYEEQIYNLPGVRDLSSMMKLGQIPAPETIDKIQESMSPSVRLRSRIIEVFMREFATMMASNFTQFYPLSMRLAILGDQGATQDDFDTDPGSFLPAWLPTDYNSEGILNKAALIRGPLPQYNRAKQFFNQVSYHIAPSSLLNASEIESQLKYLQLSRAGLVDHWTLMEKLNVPNVGNPPPGANTITERLVAEQQMGLGMQVNAAGRKSSGQELPQEKSSGAVSESG